MWQIIVLIICHEFFIRGVEKSPALAAGSVKKAGEKNEKDTDIRCFVNRFL